MIKLAWQRLSLACVAAMLLLVAWLLVLVSNNQLTHNDDIAGTQHNLCSVEIPNYALTVPTTCQSQTV